jgi:hypothetical protein
VKVRHLDGWPLYPELTEAEARCIAESVRGDLTRERPAGAVHPRRNPERDDNQAQE